MTRITRMTAAVMLVLSMTLLLPSNTRAFGYWFGGSTPVPWAGGDITWCIENTGGWGYPEFQSTTNIAFEHWDGFMTNRSIYQNCSSTRIHVEVVDFSARGWPHVPARTTVDRQPGGPIIDAELFVNKDFGSSFWFNNEHHVCNVLCAADPIDYFSSLTHEIGHALGLSHNTNGSVDHCVNGFDTENTAAACTNEFYSRDIMYFLAGDGYRRWITQDTLNGLDALGYR